MNCLDCRAAIPALDYCQPCAAKRQHAVDASTRDIAELTRLADEISDAAAAEYVKMQSARSAWETLSRTATRARQNVVRAMEAALKAERAR